MTVTLSTIDAIGENSAATPGLWNSRFSSIASNLDALNTATPTSFISSVAGTANQITASTVTGVATLSLPSALTVPGNLAVTGWGTVTSRWTAAGLASTADLKGNSTLSIDGATVLGGAATVGGALDAQSTLTVTGAAKFSSTISADGELRGTSGALTSVLTLGNYLSASTDTSDMWRLELKQGLTANPNSRILYFSGGGQNQYFYKNSNAATLRLGADSAGTFLVEMPLHGNALWSNTGQIQSAANVLAGTNAATAETGFYIVNTNGFALYKGAGFYSDGMVIGHKAGPLRNLLATTSAGTTVLNAVSSETYISDRSDVRLHIIGSSIFSGFVDFHAEQLFSFRTVAASPTSLNVEDRELVFWQPDGSGMTLCYRSAGVLVFFNSSSTAIG